MRLPAWTNESLDDLDGSARPEFLDVVPTAVRDRPADGWLWLGARALGALALLATGAVHLYEFNRFYSAIPTIGTLFVLNFVGATGLSLALLGPLERIGGRFGGALLALASAAGIALAAVSFVFLFISERTPLFGFMEPGYDPTGITVVRVVEIATVVFLGLFLAGRFWLKAAIRRW